MKITELDLEKLGFDKIVVTPEEAGDDYGYYYYEYELSDRNDNFVLLSIESTKVLDDSWRVKLFETDDYELLSREELAEFLQTILKFKKEPRL